MQEDFIENVRALALERRFDYLLIEPTGISEPMLVPSTGRHTGPRSFNLQNEQKQQSFIL